MKRHVDDAAQLLTTALADLRATWLDLATTDLLYKLVAFVVLTPLTSGIVFLSLWVGGSSVVADQDILYFALTPLGLVGLVAIVAVSLAVVALEQACLITITAATADGTPVSQLAAVRHALSRSADVLGLTAGLTARVLVIATPFLVGIGGVYGALLTEFDINYYLNEQPIEFWIAVALAAALLAGMAAVLVPRLIGWGLSLPLVVLERRTSGEALRLSRARSDGRRSMMMLVLIGWAVTSALLSSTALGMVALVGRGVAPTGQGSLTVALVLMLAMAVLWLVTSYLATFAQGASFAVLVSRLHRVTGGTTRGPIRETVEGSSGVRPLLGMVRSRWIVAGALGLAAAVAAGAAVATLEALDPGRGIVVIAHRGSSQSAPENTLAAVERAILDGADFVEIDVQLSADGDVVVVHDGDLMKTAGRDLRIAETSLEELQSVDIGSWFASEFSTQRVPTLAAVLELCRNETTVMIELKYYGPNEDLAPRVIETVEATRMTDNVVLMSLDSTAVAQVRALRPDWTVGLLAATAVGDLTTVDADYLAVSTGLATRALVRRAGSGGQDVYVWTVNDPVQMVRMVSLGVDGLITDVPATARSVLERANDMHPVERLAIALSFFFGAAAPDPAVEDDL